ncbi:MULTISPECIES: DUF4833 domain-containing protein [Olivibacter]|jgi:hypothetical protein|uniref:DUF4833 domain-containing protein n=2 Tax=Olivibacter TaxID=376469 RepID=A0ABV6HSS3_9SPHI|nr:MULTISPECIES: DUF4833 domain-containing protein [Olivibacter]MCL4638101.1 DUF4833 domain-containing protein [Olivibacter sp. UJ_SKK_5.1]MDX3917344.1 DUF4833 domain-containing protein [Pseudosphingobacterium sp.]QEL04038.1 DUF4833 domain-containing protein [Olivibacter sp. LS-1]
MKTFVLLLVASSLYGNHVCAQDSSNNSSKQVDKTKLPVPNEKEQLFYLQRDPNKNTVVYTLNKKDGKIDEDEPVSAYWILYEEDGERKDLSYIQRKFAYGIDHKKVSDNEYEIRLTSCKSIPFRLAYCPLSKQYEAFTSINNKPAIVERIFVRINGGSLFKPNVDYIELICKDSQSGQKLKHMIPMDE